MVSIGLIFGHAVVWDWESDVFRYVDTGDLAYRWGGEARPCPQCGELPTPDGYDPCLGCIPGVYSACCGHGIESGEIHWEHLRESEDEGEMGHDD